MNVSGDHCRCDEYIFSFFPLNSQKGDCEGLPSQSTHGSYGVLREAQRGAQPPDHDRFGSTIRRGLSKEYLAVLMGCTLTFVPL